jgi:pimeloyl-ACP methyl ester carboxylesterase
MFSHDGVELRGLLMRPIRVAGVAKVVLAPGNAGGPPSEKQCDYRYMIALGESLAERGIICLHYDRAGTFDSSGDWRYQTLYDRADEILAALGSQPFVHCGPDLPQGVIGHSNGGWVAPLVASLCDNVDFSVSMASGLASPSEQMSYFCNSCIDKMEISEEQKDLARHFVRTRYELSRLVIAGERTAHKQLRNKRISEFPTDQSFIETLRSLPMMQDVTERLFPEWPSREERIQEFGTVMEHADYDATAVAARLNKPTLFVLGECDELVDTPRAVRELDDLRSRNPHIVTTVMRGEGHGVGLEGSVLADVLGNWIVETARHAAARNGLEPRENSDVKRDT